MKISRIIMGMPAVVEIVGEDSGQIERVFDYFSEIDERFSTYKSTSEISSINNGDLRVSESSPLMREVFRLSEETKVATDGYFDIQTPRGDWDPSGLVKGWAINNAARLLLEGGYSNFWVEIGGDIQTDGLNSNGEEWSVGIRNPFVAEEIVKVLYPHNRGVATSGTYIRGNHIYDPRSGAPVESPIVSLTVIGPDVYEADRFATAAFAMKENGIFWLENKPNLEAYAIDANGQATITSGFDLYTQPLIPRTV